ncbi:MAG: S9 family peptidase [bacterium]|nr:MAG: S9 family peptidase [bacterium]
MKYSVMTAMVLIATIVSAPALLTADEPHAITFDDFISLGRVGSFELSPDGRWIAFEVTWLCKEENSSNTDIYLVPVKGGDVWKYVRSDGNDYSPCWSADGKYLAFISDREGTPQIWMIPTDGGEAQRITDFPTGASAPLCSPDGKWIAFTSRVYPGCSESDEGFVECNREKLDEYENGEVKARLIDHLIYRHWNHWREGRWSHLILTDVKGTVFFEINKGYTDVPPISLGGERDYDFSPDGTELCFTMNPDPVVAVSTNNDLFLMELPDGKPNAITNGNRSNDNNPRYSPDGRYIAYRAQMRPGFEADRHRLMLYDRRTGETKNLTEDFDYSIGRFAWDPNSRILYFSTADRGRYSIGKVSIHADDAAFIITGGYDTNLRVTPDGKHVVLARQSVRAPVELYRATTKGKKVEQLTDINGEVLENLVMHSVEEFWYDGAGGTRVHGMLVKPPTFEEGKRYPLILLIHGGPQGAFGDDFHPRWNAQMFASPGYVVAMLNPRGSTGYGQQFTDEISGDWAGKVYVDIMNGVDYMVTHFPFIDSDRMAAAGASYGGYMINWIEGHSQRFCCLVSHAGVYNLTSMYGATEELWFPEWEFEGTPWTNPEMYRMFSPHNYAADFGTPCLVVHGERDFRVPYTEGLQFFTALQRRGVPSKLLFFPDEDHFVRKPLNAELWWKTLHEWFAGYLR